MSAFERKEALSTKWEVDPAHSGVRADQFLLAKIDRLSRTRAQRIIACGDLRRNGHEVKPSSKMLLGDVVHLWRLPPNEQELDYESVRVVFEDSDWLVVDKPPSLAVHPTAKYLNNTLTGWIKRYAPGQSIHPCHRLDRETSGVLVCAKNRSAQASLKTGFQKGLVFKTYLAVVVGNLAEPMIVNAPLALQGERGLVRIRMIVDKQNGLDSITHVVPLKYDKSTDRTLVECFPKTGRQHQIRAHLAHIGFPIVADKLYAMGDEFFDTYTRYALGERKDELEHERHALHASRISFEFEGKNREFHCPFPNDLRGLITLDT